MGPMGQIANTYWSIRPCSSQDPRTALSSGAQSRGSIPPRTHRLTRRSRPSRSRTASAHSRPAEGFSPWSLIRCVSVDRRPCARFGKSRPPTLRRGTSCGRWSGRCKRAGTGFSLPHAHHSREPIRHAARLRDDDREDRRRSVPWPSPVSRALLASNGNSQARVDAGALVNATRVPSGETAAASALAGAVVSRSGVRQRRLTGSTGTRHRVGTPSLKASTINAVPVGFQLMFRMTSGSSNPSGAAALVSTAFSLLLVRSATKNPAATRAR